MTTVDDLRKRYPDRDSYDRALARAVRKSEDLLAITAALHVPPNGRAEIPTWLSPIADAYVRAHRAAAGEGKPVLALVSAPPQSGKTTLAETALAWWLARRPQDPLGWLSYGAELSKDKSRRIRDLARKLQVQIRADSAAAERWQTQQGGGLLAKGLAGAIVGMPGLACVVVDDPYESKWKAYSPAHKKWLRGQVQATVISRRNPRTSVFVQHTRWAVDDLQGWLLEEFGDLFEVIVVTAVDDSTGEPVVTLGGRDRSFWDQQRLLSGPDWWPLYMGSPRVRDGSLFQGVSHYEVRPLSGQTYIGVDFAYSTKATADWSVAVVFRRVDHRGYVVEVVRKQCPAPEFADELRKLQQRYPGAPTHAYAGGTELGTADLFARLGVRLSIHPARVDKVSRAQATAAQWNAGNVLVPEHAPWVEELVDEVLNFGAGGHDDQVDALVAAVDYSGWTEVSVTGQPSSARTATGGMVGDAKIDPLRSGSMWGTRGDREAAIRRATGNFEEDRHAGGEQPRGAWRPGSGRLPNRHGW